MISWRCNLWKIMYLSQLHRPASSVSKKDKQFGRILLSTFFCRPLNCKKRTSFLQSLGLCGEPIQWLLDLIQGFENFFRCERPIPDPNTNRIVDRDGNHRSGTICADFSDRLTAEGSERIFGKYQLGPEIFR